MTRQFILLRLLLSLLALVFIFFFPLTSHSEWHTDKQSIMGTSVSVTLWHENREIAQRALLASMVEMRRIDSTLSPYIESSDLSKLNRLAAKAPQRISDEMLLLLDKSIYFSRLSDGAFDITFASVGWYYNYREEKQPDPHQRQSLLPAINYHLLNLNRERKTLHYRHPKLRIDLGGVAKGHAVDRVAGILSEFGVTQATVSAGGDSRIMGDKFGKQWVIGIKNPRGDRTDQPAIRLPLADVAVSTSGDYERYFIDKVSGERVHHIINPSTGKSVKGVTSVTVLGPRGLDTDPLSTSVFVLGVERGLSLINGMPGFDCIVIDSRGKVHFSRGLMSPKLEH